MDVVQALVVISKSTWLSKVKRKEVELECNSCTSKGYNQHSLYMYIPYSFQQIFQHYMDLIDFHPKVGECELRNGMH